MKTLTPDQRIEGFTELVDENENAHLTSFLAGVAHAEKVLASQEQDYEPIGYVYSEYGNPRKNVALSNDSIPNGTPVYLRPAPRKQDDEPMAWLIPGGVTKRKDLAQVNGSNAKPLYLHPAPREFVRLSDDEIAGAWSRCKGDFLARLNPFARAIEDALEKANA